ncbi:hypothetical protein SULAZ_0285 [Sulfurihydrogenibium azorense Az-Fu1]|uniref:Uncharacterized protein n=1 Tax=Sulfurihydrogenibium azorense (strain DSM 15241 / OCM 825 / Az-Fu1) TaxID=204536 RepID=C1DT43_SULAA|nr:hypothetical protein [Sulfurihydrogenibium azorense]ACN98489.1 hypothetical protein SULAZ_0285 [Sulfurihydrogenibium azorense Az-Fu1]
MKNHLYKDEINQLSKSEYPIYIKDLILVFRKMNKTVFNFFNSCVNII